MVGTVPLEAFESFELFGEVSSVLELVFLRRNSLKKGIVTCRSFFRFFQRARSSLIYLQPTSAFMKSLRSGISESERSFTAGAHAGKCQAILKRVV